ncbi:fumarate reductase subunit C [Mycolicibacterium neworleansense]|uniref:Fumarate reductase n=1 Tax=Mycolicibacterium neworleansense TaxID=146018 RepID=A0A0H5RX14_9MYCO|nr:fumarate reductase subunit C [Mycolicibacterium neworleansense]MCV7362697.1 fumarate reductase subunit C [Mycolicibacterium neworleansense]CRZ18665.1 fumarate reductase [Mycolicibacterium neworleansense]
MTTYRQPVPLLWWTKRASYLRYMLRELSCEFVAWSVVYLVILVWAYSTGHQDWFAAFSSHPLVIVLNLVTLAFLLLHTITWFSLAPRAMVVHLRGRRVPAGAVLAGHYLAWLAVSAVIAWVVLA